MSVDDPHKTCFELADRPGQSKGALDFAPSEDATSIPQLVQDETNVGLDGLHRGGFRGKAVQRRPYAARDILDAVSRSISKERHFHRRALSVSQHQDERTSQPLNRQLETAGDLRREDVARHAHAVDPSERKIEKGLRDQPLVRAGQDRRQGFSLSAGMG